MYNPDPHLGSSGWLVAPSTVGIFIEGVIIQTRKQAIEECLAALPKKLKEIEINLERADDPSYTEGVEWNDALDAVREAISKLI